MPVKIGKMFQEDWKILLKKRKANKEIDEISSDSNVSVRSISEIVP